MRERLLCGSDLLLQSFGLSASQSSEAATRRALALIESALRLDPAYANANRATRKDALATNYSASVEAMQAELASAEADARRAIALAPKAASGHNALGAVLQSKLEFSGALRAYEQAREVEPGNAITLRRLATLFGAFGAFDKALARLAEAQAADPLHPALESGRSLIMYQQRRYEEAANLSRRVLERFPKRSLDRRNLGDCLLLLGRTAEAKAEYGRLDKEDPFVFVSEAFLKARTGDRAGSDQALANLSGDVWAYQHAEIYAQQGEIEAAFRALALAERMRDPGLLNLRTDPFLDPLRKDPRFAALEKRLNFPAVGA